MSKYSDYTDEQLFTLIDADDRHIFDELFRRYHPRIFPHVLKFVRSAHVAEEIMQELFIRVWLRREDIRMMDKPVAWLFTVASNLSFDYLKQARNQQRILAQLVKPEADSITADTLVSMRENEEQLRRAIDGLSPQRQVIFRLSREQGMTHRQISEQLNISSSTVNNQLVTALHHIRTCMKRAGLLMLGIFFF